MDDHIVEKLRKVLALTTSPVEGEAQAAAGKLQELLTKHNLDIADLEVRGSGKPQVKEEGHDLGKAAFTWKLDLAEGIARYYFCHPMVDRTRKTVRFVGRPDNVESLQMLYRWLIDQIKRVSGDERKKWMEESGEHVDPLRWQVNFGIGAASRLKERLQEKADREREDCKIYALVVHHDAEISDYLEKQYGYRTDGKKTAQQQKWDEEWEQRKKADEELKKTDIEAYYAKYPWRRPPTEEQIKQMEREDRKREKARQRRWERGGGYRYRRPETEEERRKRIQGEEAHTSGHKAGGSINLEPFVEKGADRKQVG